MRTQAEVEHLVNATEAKARTEIERWARNREHTLRQALQHPRLDREQRDILAAKLNLIADLLNFISGNGE